MEAHGLKQIDEQYKQHVQSWTNQQAQATDNKGKSIYKTFKDFFDYEKAIDSYWGKSTQKKVARDGNLIYLMRKANAQKGGTE